MDDVTALQAEAEAIVRQLQDPELHTQSAQTLHPGAAGRRRAGSGEQFWQYRRYAQTDAADQVDWRRSGRSDDLFVRESELETPRTILFWIDPAAGFDWTSAARLPTKTSRARVIALAIGMTLARRGERVGGFSGRRHPRLGQTATEHLARDLLDRPTDQPVPPRGPALAVIASDFYTPIDTWKQRMAPLLGTCRHGVMFAVSDPAEAEFPFSGRTRFTRPGSPDSRTVGRAETLKTPYLDRLAENRRALKSYAAEIGWGVVCHATDQPPVPAAAEIQSILGQFGAR